jgi:Flp pilus assembly pilin Flp
VPVVIHIDGTSPGVPRSAIEARGEVAGRPESVPQQQPPTVGWAEMEVLMTKSPVARLRNERGVTTAEYAVVTAAGCGFASVLIKLLTSDWGQRLLKTLFELVMKVLGI